MSRQVVIIGGGVIGLSTALHAAERGLRVTLIERDAPAALGCSFGNAGLVVPSHFVPLAAPGAVGLALRWMFDSESPFWFRPRLDRSLLSWAWKFARAATPARAARSIPVLLELNLAGLRLYRELARERDDFGLTERGMLMLCNTAHGFEEEQKIAAEARRLGLPAEVVSREEAQKLEPEVELDVTGGVFYPRDAHLDPFRLMATLRRRTAERGVTTEWETEAIGWRTASGRIEAVRTKRGEIEGDEFVICGGSWSPRLVRDLGVRLPVEAGKGYSLTLPHPKQQPQRALILSEGHVAVTPMGETLRFGGTMEIAGLDLQLRPARIRGLIKSSVRYMPGYSAEDFEGIEPWCGLRPCSPDGVPFIGRFARWSNLSTATGHAMMGVSLAPITGRLVAEILAGEPPSVALAPFSPDRYA